MGNTCLHYAVVAKDKDRVKLLLTPKYKSGKRVVSIAFFCFMLGLFSTVEYVSFASVLIERSFMWQPWLGAHAFCFVNKFQKLGGFFLLTLDLSKGGSHSKLTN